MSLTIQRQSRRAAALVLSIACAGVLGGCDMMHHKDKDMDHKGMTADASGKSLYERLGGEPAVTAVIDDFVGRAAADPKVNFTRQGHPNHWDPTPENVAKLKKGLVDFVTMATGGPNNYHGKSMPAVHKDMGITNAEFDAIAADLQATLKKFNVPAKETSELMTIVGGTRGDIVGK